MHELVFLNKFTIELENFAVRDECSEEDNTAVFIESVVRTNKPRPPSFGKIVTKKMEENYLKVNFARKRQNADFEVFYLIAQ